MSFRLNNFDELKWRIIDVWHGLQQTVNEWRKLLACMHMDGILNTHYDCLMQTWSGGTYVLYLTLFAKQDHVCN